MDEVRTFEDLSGHFCREAWEHTAALQQAICDHPFNQGLADGSLDRERFGFYMVQDARCLIGFSRALAMAAARAPETPASAFFAGSAQQVLVVERSLHSGELQRLAWAKEEVDSIATSPTCFTYTSFLGSTALLEPWPVLVAALVPCFWVYHHVGRTITERTGRLDDHPYRAWIASYADEAFGASVANVCNIADDAAAKATSDVVDRMLDAFTRASEYEWLFWDSAWRMEAWPTARWVPSR